MNGVFDDLDALIGGLGHTKAPPDSVPLRILGLDVLPPSRDALKSAFRARVMAAHPDLAAYTIPDVRKAAEAAIADEPDVQELVWARNVLLHKLPDTANGTAPRSGGKSRNAKPLSPRQKSRKARLAELATAIEEHRLGAQDIAKRWLFYRAVSVESKADVLLEQLANRDCRWCGECGRDLAPDDPVWREYASYRGIVTTCGECHDDYRRVMHRGPCECCGRRVHDFREQWRVGLACSEVCRKRVALERRKERRAWRRANRICEDCGERFDPRRKDSRYCSPACRQRAYRLRKAGVS